MQSYKLHAARRAGFLLLSALCLSGCMAALPLAQLAMTPSPGFGTQACASNETPGAGQQPAANCQASPMSAMFSGLGASMRSLTGTSSATTTTATTAAR
jgi:hypothetical protein